MPCSQTMQKAETRSPKDEERHSASDEPRSTSSQHGRRGCKPGSSIEEEGAQVTRGNCEEEGEVQFET